MSWRCKLSAEGVSYEMRRPRRNAERRGRKLTVVVEDFVGQHQSGHLQSNSKSERGSEGRGKRGEELVANSPSYETRSRGCH